MNKQVAIQLIQQGLLEQFIEFKKELTFDNPTDALIYYGDCLEEAVKANNFQMVEWIYENCQEIELDDQMLYPAIENGNIQIIQYLLTKDNLLHETCFKVAVTSKNMNTIQWLYNKGCPFDESSFMEATSSGDLEIAQYLYSIECPWDERTFAWAIRMKHLPMMKWLNSVNCPLSELSYAFAVWTSDIKILNWVKENDCPYDTQKCFSYLEKGRDDIEQWLLDNLN